MAPPCAFGRLSAAAFVALTLACGSGSDRPPADGPAPPAAEGDLTRELTTFGRGQTQPYEILPGIYQARGVGNTQMVVTGAGVVIVDAGLPTTADEHRALLRQASSAPVTHAIGTHAHLDHYGGIDTWREDDTEVIVHREFLEVQAYLKALSPYLLRRNRVFYPNEVPALVESDIGAMAVKALYPTLEPTLVIDSEYVFETGGVRFEVIHTPGAEGADSISVWLPDRKVLFTGDLFGPIFPMFPNLYTVRGERIRDAMPYVHSLEKVLALEPEILVPSHFEPIVGKERIRADVTRMRDAVLYVHDAVVAGMNDGKDVHTLMQEIALPPELELSEAHGTVRWSVRAIWESYAGWFHFDSTTSLYPVPARSVYPEVVEMAGGADVVARRAAARLARGETLQALHLVDMALEAEPDDDASLRVRRDALERLYAETGGVNHHEVMWLKKKIADTDEHLARVGDG